MAHYQAVVHYHFKKGREEEGVKFLEKELLQHAREYGCHDIEICQSERDTSELLGLAVWKSIDEAKAFQSQWIHKEKELLRLCTNPPTREIFKIRSNYVEKEKSHKIA